MQAFNTGLLLLPPALVMLVMMPIAGRLFDKIGPRIPAMVGLAINGIGTILLAGINADVTRSEIVVWMMIRSFGIGLSMMPIMTGGISALPQHLVSYGSAFNNVVQRTSMAFGLAALTALATQWQAQNLADRSALLHLGANADQRLRELASKGFAGLYPLWQQTQLESLARSYSNAFLIVGVLSLVSAALALFLRHGALPKEGAGQPQAAEV
jgi:MFS family permease